MTRMLQQHFENAGQFAWVRMRGTGIWIQLHGQARQSREPDFLQLRQHFVHLDHLRLDFPLLAKGSQAAGYFQSILGHGLDVLSGGTKFAVCGQ